MTRSVDAAEPRARLLARALAFEHGVARRSATAVVTTAGGFAVLSDPFPHSYAHNRLIVTVAADPALVLAEAERVLGGAGLSHRLVAVDHDAVAPAWHDAFAAAGYVHRTLVVMAATGPPDRPAGAAAELVPYPNLVSFLSASWRRSLPDTPDEVVRQLVGRRSATAAACAVTDHAVRVGGRPVAHCALYHRGRTAQVEEVETEPPWQGRGFARSVVLGAVGEARRLGCSLIFLLADADDWPRLLYRRLGFEALGRTHEFERVAGSVGPKGPPADADPRTPLDLPVSRSAADDPTRPRAGGWPHSPP